MEKQDFISLKLLELLEDIHYIGHDDESYYPGFDDEDEDDDDEYEDIESIKKK